MEKVWAGGDIVTGQATVILAMGAAKKASEDMHRFLSGVDNSWPEEDRLNDCRNC
jgi:glutamate synthase (NADPH/NADH) small chain